MQSPSHADMPETFAVCPGCRGLMRVEPEWIRQTATCPHCGAGFELTSFHSGSASTVETAKIPLGRLQGTRANSSVATGRVEGAANVQVVEKKPTAAAKRLGRYRLNKLLGSGGFGKVYLATDPELDRQVAIKLPTFSGVKNASEKFRKEARSVAKLRHPNIVAVFDHGQSHGHVYIVYEYVPGETLEQLMARERIDERQLLEWIAVLADALSYAAGESIVHRDIKPANIMIDTRGRPQIMDFGLAVALSDGVAATGGGVAGTPRYMSPEQARGDRDIGPTSDQYSLGSILYEGLTHERAVSNSGAAAMVELAEREGPPLEPLANVNSDLRQICLRAMAKEAEQRYADASDFAADLRRYLSYRPIQASSPTLARRLRLWSQRNTSAAVASLTAAVLLILIAVISSVAAVRLASQRKQLQRTLVVAETAKKKAEEHQAESERQERLAQAQAELARKNEKLATAARHEAEAATAEAEAALERELQAQAETKLAQKEADEANLQRLAASEQAESAKFQLESAEHVNRTLRYAEFLTKAHTQILQGDPSAATDTLNQCFQSQRGWEWGWLRWIASVATNEATRLEEVPQATLVALSSGGLIKTYDAGRALDPPSVDSQDLPYVSYDPDMSLAVYLKKSDAPNASIAVFGNTVTRQPVEFGAELFGKPTARLLGPLRFAVSVGGVLQLDEKGAKSYPRKYEIWELANQAESRWEGSAEYFCPSFAVHAERKLMFGCTDSRTLMTWDLRSNQPLTQTTLDFDVHEGPDAMRMNREKQLMLLDRDQNIHVVEPTTSRFVTQRRVHDLNKAGGQMTWSDDSRYLALSDLSSFNSAIEPNTVSQLRLPEGVELVPTGTEEGRETSRLFSVIDTKTSAVLCTLPMPATKFISLAERNKQFSTLLRQRSGTSESVSHPRAYRTMCRRILRVDAIRVVGSGQEVSFRDSAGGIYSYVVDQKDAYDQIELPLKHLVDVVDQAGELIAVAGENRISLIVPNSDGSFDVKALRREHVTPVRALAMSLSGERLASLDLSGVIALWDLSERSLIGKLNVAGATTLCGLDNVGRRFAIGTNDGRVIIHDLTKDRVVSTLNAHAGAVTAITVVPQFDALVSAGEDRTLKYIDTKSGQRRTERVIYTTEVASELCVSVDHGLLVCGGRSIEHMLCDEDGITRRSAVRLSHDAATSASSPDASRWLVADSRVVSIFDANAERRLFSMPPIETEIRALWYEDPEVLTVLDRGGTMYLYQAVGQ
ncbi:WD40 repeat domain-containing serine/threonine-protein kinase [Rhodopirellula sallentina]|nr:WD40 repeat domain-containing serine/threonine-protein kinase [Rhodopirellula sallentina]